MAAGISIDASSLDPVLLQLGTVSGLLTASNGSVALNTDFFEDPIGHLEQIPAARADELAGLLAQLLGSATDGALGLPGAGANRQWIPLTYTDSTGNVQHTGCSVVVESIAAVGHQPAATVLGFGASYQWQVDGATVTPYAYVPLIATTNGTVSFVLADGASAPSEIELGFTVEDKGAFGTGDFAFDGFRLAVDFAPAAVRPQFNAVLINLALPGEPPADRAFPLEPDNAAIETWITTALALIAGRVGASHPDAANSIAALLAFLGGTGAVPAPDWTNIAKETMVPSWLLAIATATGAAQAWLQALACMCSGKPLPPDGTPDVSGTGSVIDPYTIPLGTLADVTVEFALAVVPGGNGTVAFTPGLAIATPTVTPVSGQPIGAWLSALIDFATLTLGAGEPEQAKLFPRFAFEAIVANPGSGPLLALGPDLASLSVGSLQAGFTYTPAGGLAPGFAIVEVSTSSGHWPSIDPTNFGADLKVLEDAIETIVSNELQKLSTTEAGAVAQALAVLLGLVVPPPFTADPTKWPANSGLLLHDGLDAFIKNPLTAFGSYFALCLSAKVGSVPAFASLLPSAAVLLGAKPAATVTGSGSRIDPWRVPVHALPAGASCDLTAWYEPAQAAGQQRIHLGLAVDVPVALSAVTASFTTQIDLFDFSLPTASGSGVADCAWLPTIGAGVTVTGPSQAPLSLGPIAGITLGVQNLAAGISWGRAQSLQWQAGIDGLSLTPSSGTAVALGDLLLGNMPSDSLSSDLATLERAVLAAAGLGLMRAGGPIGVALTCGLGLLPDLPAIFTGTNPGAPVFLPKGFILPASWPSLEPGSDPQKFLNRPWPALAAQLNALLANDNAEAAARLFAWAITGVLPAPGTSGSGTLADPWLVPLGWHGAAVTLWNVSVGVGFGLALPLVTETVASVSASTIARLQLGTIAADGTLAVTPLLSLLCEIAPASGLYLVGDPAKQEFPAVASVMVGIDVSSAGVAPHVLLHGAQAGASSKPADVGLVPGPPPLFIPSGVSSTDFALLIGAAMNALSNAAASNKILTAGLDVLTALNLVQTTGKPARIIIMPSAWSALLANPAAYFEAGMNSVLADPTAGTKLLQQLLALIGVGPKAAAADGASDLAAVPVLLSALGLMQSTASGYVPLPSQWVALAENPIAYLGSQLEALSSAAARKQLLTALGPLLPASGSASLGPLTLAASAQGVLTVSLGRQTTVGAGVAVGAAASVTVDLVTPALTLDLLLAAPIAGQGLALNWNTDTGGLTLTLVPAGPGPAGFAPLELLPTPPDMATLAEDALLSLLSTGLGTVITAEVLPQAPVVLNIMQALGLIVTGADNQRSVVGLRPAFIDPVAWLLDPSRFGNGSGQFDLGRLGSVLNALPGSGIDGPDGLTVKPSGTDGLVLAGLPFGISSTLAANDNAGLTVGIAVAPLAIDGVSVSAQAQAAFAHAAAPALSGSTTATWTFSGNSGSIGAKAGFASAVTLTATGELDGGPTVTLDLVPFEGLNQIISSGAPAILLQEIGKLLAEAWAKLNNTRDLTAGSDELIKFIQAVIDAGAALGITGSNFYQVVEAFVADPLSWLKTTFTGAAGAAAIARLVDLLVQEFSIKGVTVVDNQLQYQAPLPDNVPGNLTLQFGPSGSSLALSAGVGLQPGPLQIAFDAGATVSTSDGAVTTKFGSTLGIDLAAVTGNRLTFSPAIVLAVALPGATPVTLSVYPMGTKAATVAELLPSPGLTPGDPADWIMQVVTGLVVPVVADAVLATEKATNLLDHAIGSSSVTLGNILTDANLVTPVKSPGKGYQLADVVAFYGDKSPSEIAQQLVAAALKGFAGATIINVDGVTVEGMSKASGASTDYGVAVTMKDVALTSGAKGKLLLQVGDLYGATVDQSWLALASSHGNALTPGLGLYFLRASSGNTPSYSFHFGLELGSVGVDYVANPGQNLFSVEGVTTDSLGVRLALNVDQDGQNFLIGGAVRADRIGLPLGPSFQGSSQSGNPVAQSLLASGGSQSASGSGAVNPTFGATFGYIDKIYFAFRPDGSSDPGGQTEMIWLPVQRSFGPLQCQQIGVGSDDGTKPTFNAGFDGSVSLAGLAIGLSGLEVKIPLKKPTEISAYGLSLSGLSVSFAGGPVSITGALLESAGMYTGELQITSPALALTAIGSYGTIAGAPSLFAYALVPFPLGGPPCFFVTGLAGGFGYNRGFIVPSVDQIATFPFVAWASNPASAPAPDQGTEVLTQLGAAVPPVQGENWLAAGVTFTSFELLNTTALLVIQFGNSFQLDLLGTTTLTLPKGDPSPYVYAELELEVVLDPDDGVLKALAQLTPNSYVITSECHLTGGFAFYSWFSGSHAGDFVVTFGGYNASYSPQNWYPQQSDVPRLGISWDPGGGVHVAGSSYFALTPSCVMAGEQMQATYSSGSLSAWFSAYTDFLINWHPFYYDARAGVSVGASITIHIIVSVTLSIELSATLHAWGPPFAGEVEVDWTVISFTIPIGATHDNTAPDPLSWQDFSQKLLPGGGGNRNLLAFDSAPASPPAWVKVTALAGKLAPPPGVSAGTIWIIDPARFTVRIDSVVPMWTIACTKVMGGQSFTGEGIGIYPMNLQNLAATLTIDLAADGDRDNAPWSFAPILQGAASALWATNGNWNPTPGSSALGESTIAGCLLGVTGSIGAPPTPSGPPVMQISDLLTDKDTLPKRTFTAMAPAAHPVAPDAAPSTGARSVIASTVMASAAETRTQIVAAAAALASLVVANGRLDVLAAEAPLLLQQDPMVGAIAAGLDQRVRHASPAAAPVSPRRAPMARRPASRPQAADAPERPVALAVHRSVSRADGRHAVQTIRRGSPLPLHGAALAGVAQGGDDAAMLLHPGAGVVWRMPKAHRCALASDGALPLRIVAIGANGWPVLDTLTTEFANVALPGDSRVVGIFASPSTSRAADWAGWHADLALLQLRADCLVGHRCVVRTQAPLLRRARRLLHDLGAWHGHEIAARNRVQSGGRPQPGWIMTVLPAGATNLAILFGKEASGGGFDPSAAAAALDLTVLTPSTRGPLPVEAAGWLDTGDSVALLFRVEAPPDAPIHVRTEVTAAVSLVGVVGRAQPLDRGGLDAALAPPAPVRPSGRTSRVAWIEEAAA